MKVGTVVMVNRPGWTDYNGQIGVVVKTHPIDVKRGDSFDVDDGVFRRWLFTDELEVLHVPLDVGDIVMVNETVPTMFRCHVGDVGVVVETSYDANLCIRWCRVQADWDLWLMEHRFEYLGSTR